MSTLSRQHAAIPTVDRGGVLDRLGRRIVAAAAGRIRSGELTIVEAGGAQTFGDGRGPRATLFVRDASFYRDVAFRGSVGAAEAYMAGRWDSDDVASLVELLLVNYDALARTDASLRWASEPFERAAYWLRSNTRKGSRRNIAAHYDLSNEFFQLWLDPTMSYSSAIFDPAGLSLEDAQREKMDRACRTLSLSPRDHLLEIGTGWGALAIHAAREYGCRVTTTTISENQFELATRRVSEAGLGDRVKIVKQDYRDLRGTYDKVVSIEMIEAVGREYLGEFFARISALLRPTGAALIQAITIRDQFDERASRRVDFLKKYIFPGSCLLGMSRMNNAIRTRTDMEVRSVEDFGGHYARTLRLWHQAFDQNIEAVRALGFDDRFARMWSYYLRYCEGAMRARHCSVVQMLLTKPRNADAGVIAIGSDLGACDTPDRGAPCSCG